MKVIVYDVELFHNFLIDCQRSVFHYPLCRMVENRIFRSIN